jgi:RNA polymerase I-specific transcription initiation factor RRN7
VPLEAKKESKQNGEALIKERYNAVNSAMTFTQPQPDPEPVKGRRKRPERDFCPVWRKQDDLPEAARILYRDAADSAAIPLQTLITSAVQVERRLEIWSAEKERSKKKEAVDPKGKRKAVPQPGDNSE